MLEINAESIARDEISSEIRIAEEIGGNQNEIIEISKKSCRNPEIYVCEISYGKTRTPRC